MRKRSVVIVNKLINNGGKSLTIQELAKEFHVSNKTIHNDIQEINTLFEVHGLQQLRTNEHNVLQMEEVLNIRKVQNAIDSLDFYSYHLSKKERIMYIVSALLKHNGEFITMQQLADVLRVTRITIINDFEIIKQQLQDFDIYIYTSSKKGVMVKAKFFNCLQLLVNVYQFSGLFKDTPKFYQEEIYKVLETEVKYKEIYSVIETSVQKRNVVFSGEVQTRIAVLIYVLVNCKLQQDEGCPRTKSTRLDFLFEEVLAIINVEQKEKRLAYYRMYLEQFHILDLVKSTNYIELYEIVRYFLHEVGKDIKYGVEEDDLLIESLVLHLRSVNELQNMVFPINDSIHLPIKMSILKKAIDKNKTIIENFLKYPLSETINNSILLHIGASLVRQFSQTKKIRVIIVCATSMATGKFLEAQVKTYFDFEIVQVSAANKISEEMLIDQEIDFIISSIQIHLGGVETIQVNAKLTMEDLNNIQAKVFAIEKTAISINNQKKMLIKRAEYLFDNMKEEDLQTYSSTLEKLIESFEEQLMSVGKQHLHLMLKPKYIQINEEGLDWERAIRSAGKLLVDHGYVNEHYLDCTVANVHEFGDYIVIAPHIALAHAGSDDGVYKDGLSLLVSQQAITFKEGTPVHLVFCFASTGEKEYSDLLKDIVAIGKNKKHLQMILSLKNSIDVYYKLIK